MKWTPAVLALALTGCVAMGPKMQRIEPGMTAEQIEAQLGRPDGVSQVEGYTVWTYGNRLTSDWGHDRADYFVVLDGEGRVVQYGHGEVRPSRGGVVPVVIVPL